MKIELCLLDTRESDEGINRFKKDESSLIALLKHHGTSIIIGDDIAVRIEDDCCSFWRVTERTFYIDSITYQVEFLF